MLTGLLAAALAAGSWTATCSAKDDPSLWFVFTSAPDAKPLTDYDCPALYFDSSVACTHTIGVGKVRPSGTSAGGTPLLELRYLPYGDQATILTFLNQPGGGVLYKPPPPENAGTTPASQPPPPTAEQLLWQYLMQRNKASAATKNVTIHIWSCPAANFSTPDEAIDPFGMTSQLHAGKVSLY